MRCKHCGAQIPDSSVFCMCCGKKNTNEKTDKKSGRVILTAVIVLLVLAAALLVYNQFLSPVKKAEDAIEAIGIIEMDSLEKLEAAEQLYSGLSEQARAKVKNAGDLTRAREDYDRMVREIEAAQTAIDLAKSKTYYADGKPFVDAADRKIVEDARAAYEILWAGALTSYLEDRVEDLENAEEGLLNFRCNELYLLAQSNQEAGLTQEAIDAYRELLNTYPDSDWEDAASLALSDCLCTLADAAFKKRDYEAALPLYEEALDANSSNTQASGGAMSCLARELEQEMRTGDLEVIEEKLEAALQKYGQSEEYQNFKEKLQKKIESQRPRNGQVIDKKMKWGRGKLTVKADSRDALIKVEEVNDPSQYATFYVRANSSATINLEDGQYTIKYAVGDTWYSKETLFGKKTAYTKAGRTMSLETTYSGNYVYYSEVTVTLYTVEGGNLSTSSIPASSF